MNFVVYFAMALIGVLFGFWIGRIYSITKMRLKENALLEELRKLCNELLKIKNKGIIVITSLSVSEGKGPSRVVVTTLPKGEN